MAEVTVERKTNETYIQLTLGYPATGASQVMTGVGFLDHMLVLFARHGGFDIRVQADGDLQVDAHHTVEDVGICLGKAFAQLFTDIDKRNRFGSAIIPMDEALAEAIIDLSGRPYLHFVAEIPRVKLGDYDAELTEEFFRAFANHFKITLHIILRYGKNTHHCIEAIFKSVAKALSQALAENPYYCKHGSSTKGVVDG